MENKRRQLMYAIQMYDFYLYELQLYLDTHPTCRNGLFAFRRYKELREKAVRSY
ncbi:MAG: spore coat protein CotJB, partial [Clostridia bacterium]